LTITSNEVKPYSARALAAIPALIRPSLLRARQREFDRGLPRVIKLDISCVVAAIRSAAALEFISH
jgi:hypothetical protein